MAVEPYPHGHFSWTDLATTDPDAAKRFYGELFGWSSIDLEMGADGIYTIVQRDGADVGGLFQQMPEEAAQGVPPHWNAYVAVDDCDAAATAVPGLGGRVLMPPFDIPGTGRMAVIADPQGAVISLWNRMSPHAGAVRRGAIAGTMCWTELLTTDTAAAAAFFGRLLGWTTRVTPMPDGDYTEFLAEGTPVAGMMAIRDEWGDVPPHWMVYFAVDDCDETVGLAKGLGGAPVMEPFDVPEVGRIAVLSDPQGAAFAVIKLGAST